MSARALVLDSLPIADIIDRYVLSHPDNARYLETVSDRLSRMGVSLVSYRRHVQLPLGPISEPWDSSYKFFKCAAAGENSHFFNPASQSVNDLLFARMSDVLANLRNGVWIAEGVADPSDRNMSTPEITTGWWSRSDTALHMYDGKLIRKFQVSVDEIPKVRESLNRSRPPPMRRRFESRYETMFFNINVRDVRPQERLNGKDCTIGETMAVLADPSDRTGLAAYVSNPSGQSNPSIKHLANRLKFLIRDLLAGGFLECRSAPGKTLNLPNLSSRALTEVDLNPFNSTLNLRHDSQFPIILSPTGTDKTLRPTIREGRPSRKSETYGAYTDLFHEGLIDLHDEKKAIYEQVRQRLFSYAGNSSREGLSDDAVENHLSARITSDRSHRSANR